MSSFKYQIHFAFKHLIHCLTHNKALIFEDTASLTANSEFFPIIFESPDPEVFMAATDDPSKRPTPSPTESPSFSPTTIPTMTPSLSPSKRPSQNPTNMPTNLPTPSPTAAALPCGLSEAARKTQIIKILNVQSVNPNSPQDLASNWIIDNDDLYLCPDNEKAIMQRYVAAVLYFSVGGGTWNQCNAPRDLDNPASIERANEECRIRTSTFPDLTSGSNAWLTPSNECEWGGLACLPDGSTIAEVSFENNGFVGTIPVELKEWKELRRLALQQGGLFGTIPTELSLLSNLLVLGKKMSYLLALFMKYILTFHSLDLDYNELTGSLPGEMFENWNVLKELDLNNNLLE